MKVDSRLFPEFHFNKLVNILSAPACRQAGIKYRPAKSGGFRQRRKIYRIKFKITTEYTEITENTELEFRFKGKKVSEFNRLEICSN
jgi:hypothetical protein